ERGIYTGEVDFYITDPAKLNDVTRNVQLLPDIDWTTHFIRSNDFQYSKIADQLLALGDLVKILLVCVSVVSAALLTLILMLRIRGRMQEVGIFLAVGISKKMILGQFLLEILSVAIVAFILGYVASFGITGLLEMGLFREMNPNLLNEQTITTGINSSMHMNSYLKLGIGKIMVIYLSQLIVITVSTLVSGMAIVRLKPKEILSKMS
ncbi:MAG: FtsX-like permease family protein, partial [Oscillospiraceae bacterium]|nr:FtsX-like permease family protein [Oscillospiraceae bacterium]